MRRGNVGLAIAALLAFAGYSIFVVIVAISGEGNDSVFWISIVVIVLLAAVALWGAKRLFARRFQ